MYLTRPGGGACVGAAADTHDFWVLDRLVPKGSAVFAYNPLLCFVAENLSALKR